LTIEFSKTIRKVAILNPMTGFKRDEWEIEFRSDPLTGRNTTVIPKLRDYWLRFVKSDYEQLRSLVVESSKKCPFCPDNALTRTPKFLEEEFEEGRLTEGEAVAFPNLIGHADRSAVVVLSRSHYLPLSKFDVNLLFNGLKLGIKILKRWSEIYEHIDFGLLIFNYLPPAGSTIIHPHMQVLGRDRPVTLQKLLIESSFEYTWRNGSSYWRDLINTERELNERYLNEKDGIVWIVPYAPTRGIMEVHGIAYEPLGIFELDDKHILAIADGMSKILLFYENMGVSSFNAAIIPGPLRSKLDYYHINIRVIARPGISRLSFTDSWCLPYLLWDGEAIEEPESLASELKNYFG